MKHHCRTLWRSALALLIASGLSGCSDWVLFNSKGEIGIAQRDLIITAVGLMLIVVIPAILLTFVFAWKYRASNKNAKYTPDWAHSTKVEIVVWGVPLLIIFTLAIIVWKSTHALDPFKPLESDRQPVVIDVIATDWKWVFVYPEQGIATVNEIAFPENTPIAFNITSNGAMNSFFIPQLGGQIYAMAGMRTQLHLIANEAGVYDGISSNYSGSGFSGMKFKAHALSDAGFEAWVQKVKASEQGLDFEGYKQLAQPSKDHPVTYYGNVQPGLFKQVIDQFIGVGANTRDRLDIGDAPQSGTEE